MLKQITFGQAANIALLNRTWLSNLMTRRPDLFRDEWFTRPAGPGKAGWVEPAGVLWLAVAAQIMWFGTSPQPAAQAAWSFTDSEDFALWLADERPPGHTLMAIRPTSDRMEFTTCIVNIMPGELLGDALSKIGLLGLGENSPYAEQVAVALIDLDALANHVNKAIRILSDIPQAEKERQEVEAAAAGDSALA